ncbi:hypothetical protein ACJ5ZS_15850 [Aeromonas salmonicida]|uniref:hypothetical protein n=1 Tax=Aeromonas salmonicida TaxID=645 RepID=UPI0038BA61DA
MKQAIYTAGQARQSLKEEHYRELALEFAFFIFLHLALSPALLMPANRQLTDFLLMGTPDLAYFNKVDKT